MDTVTLFHYPRPSASLVPLPPFDSDVRTKCPFLSVLIPDLSSQSFRNHAYSCCPENTSLQPELYLPKRLESPAHSLALPRLVWICFCGSEGQAVGSCGKDEALTRWSGGWALRSHPGSPSSREYSGLRLSVRSSPSVPALTGPNPGVYL